MRKEQIITTNNDQMEEKGMKSRFIHFKKRFVPALSGALMGVMLMSTTCFAAGTGTSAVTQPLENLKTLSPITMLVMMESIQNRIVENGKRGKATWLYIDEFHVLLNSEYSAKYLQQLWKKVRKQGGLCTGITQNVVDLLQNYTATTMLANSEFVALLKQANTDSSKMAEVIGVSEAQLRFVTNTASGMGLIKCGSVVIPFDNQISKDTDLYRLYNTNIHEKIAEQKKKEAMLQ